MKVKNTKRAERVIRPHMSKVVHINDSWYLWDENGSYCQVERATAKQEEIFLSATMAGMLYRTDA